MNVPRAVKIEMLVCLYLNTQLTVFLESNWFLTVPIVSWVRASFCLNRLARSADVGNLTWNHLQTACLRLRTIEKRLGKSLHWARQDRRSWRTSIRNVDGSTRPCWLPRQKQVKSMGDCNYNKLCETLRWGWKLELALYWLVLVDVC